MSAASDEQLLDRLGAALAPTPIEPSAQDVDAIRALVVDGRVGVVVACPRDAFPVNAPVTRSWRRPRP